MDVKNQGKVVCRTCFTGWFEINYNKLVDPKVESHLTLLNHPLERPSKCCLITHFGSFWSLWIVPNVPKKQVNHAHMGLLIRSFTVSWGCDPLFERQPGDHSQVELRCTKLASHTAGRSRLEITFNSEWAEKSNLAKNPSKHMQTCQAWIWHNLWTWAVKGTWKVKKSSMELTVPTYHGVLLSNPSFCVFNAPGLFYRQRPAHLEVNYYVKHLVQDTDGGFNQGLEWIVEGQLLKTEGKEGSLRDSWKVSVSLAMVQVANYRLEDGGVSQVSGRSFGTSALQTSMYEVKMSMNSYTNHNVNTYPWYSNLNLTLTWQMTWNPSNRWSLNVASRMI